MRVKIKVFMSYLLLSLLLFFNTSMTFSDVDENIIVTGDLLQFGSYNGSPILWYVYKTDENNNLMIISRDILCIKPFDAAGDEKAKDEFYSYAYYYGSNSWEDSALRKWLNSSDKKVEWNNNLPDKNNVFKGENAFNREAGFLHNTNFSKGELSAIIPTHRILVSGEPIDDLVTLLSYNEYQALQMNRKLYPIQMPTLLAINNSDYKNNSLKPGNQFPIWTIDPVDNPYATHAVKVVDKSGEEMGAPASSGRYGVMPVITLNHDLLTRYVIGGDGSSGNPFTFEFISAISIPKISIIAIFIVIIGVTLVNKNKIRRRIKKIEIVTLFLLGMLIPCILSYGLPVSVDGNNYLIIRDDALQKESIINRMQSIANNSYFFIFDEQGNDVSETVDKKVFANMTKDTMEDLFRYLEENHYYLLCGGDFRITNFSREIDGVFNGDHYVVPIDYAEVGFQVMMDKSLNEIFKAENLENFKTKDYEAIKSYLKQNNLTIRHPSDTSGIGIPSLYWDL